ncbi:MAG: zinc transporter ZupT [Spirochaetes bacterium]|nr:zinc transporter ZupT [Spirochaetota bacterium]
MNIDTSLTNVLFAFSLTLFAGLATSVGSVIGFFAKRTNTKFLSLSLGFSAGVMIYVSFVEIFVKAKDAITTFLNGNEIYAYYYTVIAFFGGILLIGIIDKLIPEIENPHELHSVEELSEESKNRQSASKPLLRMGLFTALAIGIHNFPEGLATFTAALSDASLGFAIAVAIAIHNIPEGIAVSVPVYYATGDRKKAFYYSFISGVAEPLGALIGYIILRPFFNDLIFGILFAMVAGIMVFISLDELLPSAQKYGEHHLSIYGLILGMVVMAVSLLLFL